MTRRAFFILLGVSVSAVAAFGVLALRRRDERPSPKPPPGAAPPEAPSLMFVLFGRDGGREVLVRRRAAAPARAEFLDAALLRRLGAEPGPELVEAWIYNGGDDAVFAFAEPLELALADGSTAPSTPLRALAEAPPPVAAGPWLAALAPEAGAPLGNGAARRAVFALPPGVRFAASTGGALDGVRLKPALAHVAAVEAYADEGAAPLASLLADAPSRVESAPRPESRR